jgi:hypothetical protein
MIARTARQVSWLENKLIAERKIAEGWSRHRPSLTATIRTGLLCPLPDISDLCLTLCLFLLDLLTQTFQRRLSPE